MMRISRNGPTWEAVFLYAPSESKLIVGIDEVGRGAWAGPVVAAAVILPLETNFEGLNDSKLVTARRRESLELEIREIALAIGVGWVEAPEIDEHGLSWAIKESGLRALADMASPYDIIMLDGNSNYLSPEYNSVAVVRADSLMIPVAAASIIAKVARDKRLVELARELPNYGFEQHKGYGTALHRGQLEIHGVTKYHRKSYAPLKKLT
jgi:ribonuclease HII